MIIQNTRFVSILAVRKHDLYLMYLHMSCLLKRADSRVQLNHAMELLESHSYKEVSEMTGIRKNTLLWAKKKLELSV